VTDAPKGLPVSVQVRLVQHAKATGIDPNVVLARYAAERFLYRLSRSRYADRFVLKGALMMLVWLGETIRPTRDADLLGFGEVSQESLARIFTDVCNLNVEADGLQYLPSSIRIAPIRPEDAYGGFRATIRALLGSARLHVQVDVGIGDAVVPEPEWLEYPSLLDFPMPRLKVYRPETAIAEKLHAMVMSHTAERCSASNRGVPRADHRCAGQRDSQARMDTGRALGQEFVASLAHRSKNVAFDAFSCATVPARSSGHCTTTGPLSRKIVAFVDIG